jgi:hypothetical protein
VSLILAWVVFPLVLAAVGAGWGVLVERAAGARLDDVILVPLGLAAALVVAGMLTTFTFSAPASITVVAVGAAAGLILLAAPRVLHRSAPIGANPAGSREQQGVRVRLAPGRWPLLAALGVFLVYGAPVLLSGKATFTGYLKLDDTATWFNVVDIVMSHSHSLSAVNAAFHPPSDFTTVFTGDVGEQYPLGAFMLLGVGHGLTGIDPAWIIQPYFACCAAALALGVYALIGPLVSSQRLRALVAFIAAQPALLYGYSLWGGIKEMTAAFLLVLGVGLTAALMRRSPPRRELRGLIPLAVTAAALIQVLQIGGGGWAGPALLLLVIAWLLPRPRLARLRAGAIAIAALGLMTAVLILPVWVSLSKFLNGGYHGLFSEGQTVAEKYGNLIQPTSGWQLAGIWPAGDFRFTAPALPTVPLIVVAVIAAVGAVWACLRRRQFGPPLYVAVVLSAGGLVWVTGTTPWVLGKSLALSSPAVLTAALTGAAMLWGSRSRAELPPLAGGAQASPRTERVAAPPARSRPSGGAPWLARMRRRVWVLGPVTMLLVGGGVAYSNVLSYTDVTLAPRDRLAEVQHIGDLVAGKGPTFINYYEAYADRHFLRDGAPVEPAEYRPVTLPLRSGTALTKAAWANIDAFPLSTLLPYRSIVTIRSPMESRPPSIWKLVWEGRYYQLWQRPEPAPETILEHIPYGEENVHLYCGNAENGPSEPLCSVPSVSIPSCPQLHGFARKASAQHAHLLAYQRPEPVFTRGDEVLWPGAWIHETGPHALIPTRPGTAIGHIAIPNPQRYELYLNGSFGRGFEVWVDGRKLGTVKDQLSGFISSIPVGEVNLSAGIHKFEYTYPQADLTPGNGETLGTGEFAVDARFTMLSSVALEPLQFPSTEMISVAPAEVARLCGRPLDWVELVSGEAGS